ncbi:hypothetical protein T4B_7122 [Trichinella pseudospiralis]|uniref:Uncharacterized protein n=1 Tax=Trichinella pseudospiralis TaxID=6337 RepID=A0A0V1GHH9_TRIPS|nr:hypothetical protein T4B_7122 [Trichinella pseudospiralis]
MAWNQQIVYGRTTCRYRYYTGILLKYRMKYTP